MKKSIGLSFNGVATVYCGEAAEFGVLVAPSGIGSARAERLATELSCRLGREVVVGDAELTIYIGKSAEIPSLGLAEGNGQGSAAFVNLDATASDELLLEVAAHEAGHLLGTVRHAGEGLAACAYTERVYVVSPKISGGLLVANSANVATADCRYLFVSANGSVTNMTVSTGGGVYLRGNGQSAFWSGGTIKAGGVTVSNGGVANEVTVSNGTLHMFKGGTAYAVSMTNGALQFSSGGGLAENVYANGANVIINVVSGGVLSSLFLSNGTVNIFNGEEGAGLLSDAKVSGGTINVSDGGIARAVDMTAGTFNVSEGGVASNVGMTGGTILMSGGLAENVSALWGGTVRVSSGATLDGAEFIGKKTRLYVSGGGVADGVTMTSGACVYVYKNGDDIGTLTVRENGGLVWGNTGVVINYIANEFTDLQLDGSATVHSGTTATRTTIYEGGSMQIFASGSATDTVMSGGSVNMKDGYLGIAAMTGGAVTASSGSIIVSADGTARNISIVNGAGLTISQGAEVSGIDVSGTNKATRIYAYGAEIDGLTMNVASADVYSDTLLKNLDITGSARVHVTSSILSSANTSNGAYLWLMAGGSGRDITVGSAGYFSLWNATAIADGVTVSSGGTMQVNAVASGFNYNVASGAILLISGTANTPDNFVWCGNSTVIEAGAIENYGADFYAADGVFHNVELNVGGATVNRLRIGDGVTIQDGKIAHSGALYVYSGGVVSGLVAYPAETAGRDIMYVYSGGLVKDLIVSGETKGPGLKFSAGAVLSGFSNSGGYIRGYGLVSAGTNFAGETWAHSDGLVRDVTVLGGGLWAESDGVLSDIVVSGGNATLRDGIISGATVYDGGTVRTLRESDMNISTFISGGWRNGKAYDVVLSGGSMEVRYGSAIRTTVSAGAADVFEGGSMLDATVNSGATITFSGGALGSNISAVGGATGTAAANVFVRNATVSGLSALMSDDLTYNTPEVWFRVSNGGVVEDLYISGGRVNVTNKGEVSGVRIVDNGCVYIYSGGSGYDFDITSVTRSAILRVSQGYASGIFVSGVNNYALVHSEGGLLEDVTAISGGRIYASALGTIRNAVVSGGTMLAYGTISGATINGGNATVYADGAISGVKLLSGSVDVRGTVSTGVVSSGTVRVSAGAIVDGIKFSAAAANGALLRVSGGTVSNALLAGGSMIAVSGGTISGVTVLNNTLHASSAGTVGNATIVGSGAMFRVINHGVAENVRTMSDGYIAVSNGGRATNVSAVDGGLVYISQGGVIEGVQVDGGRLIMRGGVCSNAVMTTGELDTIESRIDGELKQPDGIISGVTMAGGRLFVFSGAALNVSATGGVIDVTSGGTATFASIGGDATLNIDYSDGTTAARIDTLATVGTTVDVNVTGIDAAGTYALAATGNAALSVDVIDGVYEQKLANGGSYTNAATGFTYGFDGTNVTATAFAVAAKATAAALSTDDAALNTNDRAAKWDATTTYSGSVTFANSSIAGDAWLVIDGTNVSTALYGAEGTFDHTVNIAAKSGTIRNLAAGAVAGGSVDAVNLTLEGANLTGVAYAGGFGTVENETKTGITAGSFTKDFYAGALANKLASATSVGDISLTVDGGTFSGNIYGASAVKVAGTDGTRHTAGDVTLTVTGGSTTKGTQACIFAGGYATGDGTGTVYTVDSVTATIAGGSWGEACGGRGIFGGVMASGVTAEVTGDVNLTISGGEMGNVYGGGWAQKSGASSIVTGSVNITIAGGTVANVFGGGTHSTSGGTTSVESVNITVSGGTITGAIYAKGQLEGDSVTGSAVVTITGDYLETGFAADIYGYSYVGGEGVSDALNFADCRGAFTGAIGGFAGVNFSGDTRVSFAADSISNTAWNFDVTERGGYFADDALLAWSDADFSTGTITLNLATGDTNEWSLVDAAADTAYNKFNVQVDGTDIATGLDLDQAISGGAYDGWGFTLDDTVLKFKQLA